MPNVDKFEYVAVIWKDGLGQLHTTSIEQGSTNSAPASLAWDQIDFAGGGSVVAVMHIHPTLYNRGTETNPIWDPVVRTVTSSVATLSSGNF